MARVLRTPGRPLDPQVRGLYEARLGWSFGDVRIHDDADAITSARAISALAFTVGNDIVFGAGRFAPAAPEGRRLLAPELIHVMQQAPGSRSEPAWGGLRPSPGLAGDAQPTDAALPVRGADDAYEHEADRLAEHWDSSAGLRSALPGLATPAVQRAGVSFELKDAAKLPPPVTSMTGLSTDEQQVLAWLQAHRSEIVAAEQRFRVDRRAIAGAIAWEALENVRSTPIDGLGRAVGPGKVHYSTERSWGEGDPVSKQVEAAGYLPRQSMASRKAILATPSGAIEYIGAIMIALAEIAASSGYDIRCDPVMLTQVYQGADLPAWRAHMKAKKAPAPLTAGNPMALWVKGRLAYLEEGVGAPALESCAAHPGPAGTPPTPVLQSLPPGPSSGAGTPTQATVSPPAPPTGPTGREIGRDEMLRGLAARPGLALPRWRRLSDADRTVVVTYMTMFYDAGFARRFLEAASRGSRPGNLITITNVPTSPKQLQARGFRLQQDGPVEYWVHPSGDEFWFIKPSTSSQAAAKAAATGSGTAPKDPRVAEAQAYADDLTRRRDLLVGELGELRRMVGTPEYARLHAHYFEQFNQWQELLNRDLEQVAVLEDEVDDVEPTEQARLVDEILQVRELERWKQMEWPRSIMEPPLPTP